MLSEERRSLVDAMWSAARKDRERYCAGVIDGDGTTKPSCIDLAAWPAISGDHSCSPSEFLSSVLGSDWIMKVAGIGAETKRALSESKSRERIFNEWARSNLALQVADRQYTSRAMANKGHFMVTRDSNDFDAYLARVLAPEAEPNAIGNYAYYHMAALAMARGWLTIGSAVRPELARDILATEALALHFLEDSFAAGHVTGSWGNIAERKGTHDFYSEFGLDVGLWNGKRSTILGDAHIRDADRVRTAAAVAESLAQLTDAASHPDSPAARIAATIPRRP